MGSVFFPGEETPERPGMGKRCQFSGECDLKLLRASTGSLASQRHPGKFPKVPGRRPGTRGFPAAPRARWPWGAWFLPGEDHTKGQCQQRCLGAGCADQRVWCVQALDCAQRGPCHLVMEIEQWWSQGLTLHSPSGLHGGHWQVSGGLQGMGASLILSQLCRDPAVGVRNGEEA